MLVNYGSREYYMPSGLTFRKWFNLVNREANSFIPLALDLQQKVFAIIWPKTPTHTRVRWGKINVFVMLSVQKFPRPGQQSFCLELSNYSKDGLVSKLSSGGEEMQRYILSSSQFSVSIEYRNFLFISCMCLNS